MKEKTFGLQYHIPRNVHEKIRQCFVEDKQFFFKQKANSTGKKGSLIYLKLFC